jgi:hypothetical protein
MQQMWAVSLLLCCVSCIRDPTVGQAISFGLSPVDVLGQKLRLDQGDLLQVNWQLLQQWSLLKTIAVGDFLLEARTVW